MKDKRGMIRTYNTILNIEDSLRPHTMEKQDEVRLNLAARLTDRGLLLLEMLYSHGKIHYHVLEDVIVYNDGRVVHPKQVLKDRQVEDQEHYVISGLIVPSLNIREIFTLTRVSKSFCQGVKDCLLDYRRERHLFKMYSYNLITKKYRIGYRMGRSEELNMQKFKSLSIQLGKEVRYSSDFTYRLRYQDYLANYSVKILEVILSLVPNYLVKLEKIFETCYRGSSLYQIILLLDKLCQQRGTPSFDEKIINYSVARVCLDKISEGRQNQQLKMENFVVLLQLINSSDRVDPGDYNLIGDIIKIVRKNNSRIKYDNDLLSFINRMVNEVTKIINSQDNTRENLLRLCKSKQIELIEIKNNYKT